MNQPLSICLHTIKWFQALLWNANNLTSIICLHTVKWLNSSIWPIDRIMSSATTPDQSGSGSNGNEGVLHILRSSWTGALPSNGLMSYPRQSQVLTPLPRYSQHILLPHLTGLKRISKTWDYFYKVRWSKKELTKADLQGSLNKFSGFFIWALLLIVHIWNSCPLRYNLLQLQCTCCTVPTTSGRTHGSPLVSACQWPSSQPLSSPQLSHNDSLWA